MEKLRGLVGKLSSSGAAITKAADLKGPIELGGNNPALQFGMFSFSSPSYMVSSLRIVSPNQSQRHLLLLFIWVLGGHRRRTSL